ncbi:MAG TPA: hypothetical protein VIT91_09085 [Chthoniobacterales bacterium]
MDAIRFTNAKTKREAVVAALQDFNRRQRMAALVKHPGTFDSLMTNDEIESLEETRNPLAGIVIETHRYVFVGPRAAAQWRQR